MILRSKAELDQFSEGFEACGVLAAIERNPDVTREFFIINGQGRLISGKNTLPFSLSLMLTTDDAINSLHDAIQ